jgi:hypothetical protein
MSTKTLAAWAALLTLAAIAPAGASVNNPVACWKYSATRGAGTIPATCKSDEEHQGLLCYPKCRAGYSGVGPVCWQSCPSGFTDTGGFCTASDGLIKGRNTADCPWYDTCGTWHACGASCPAGYVNTGCTCTARTFAKGTYGRTAGRSPDCAPGQDKDAGLCYETCANGAHGVGPVCYGTCPANFPTPCGAMCTVDGDTCATETTGIILQSAGVAAFVLSAGTSSAVTETAEGAADANQLASASQTYTKWLGRVVTASKVVNTGLGAEAAADAYTTNAASFDGPTFASAVTGITDPTGITGLAMQLTKPVCGQNWGVVYAITGKAYPYSGANAPGVTTTVDTIRFSYTPVGGKDTELSQLTWTASGREGQTIPSIPLNTAIVDAGGTITIQNDAKRSDGTTYHSKFDCALASRTESTATIYCQGTDGKTDRASYVYDNDKGTITFSVNGPAEIPGRSL